MKFQGREFYFCSLENVCKYSCQSKNIKLHADRSPQLYSNLPGVAVSLSTPLHHRTGPDDSPLPTSQRNHNRSPDTPAVSVHTHTHTHTHTHSEGTHTHTNTHTEGTHTQTHTHTNTHSEGDHTHTHTY